MNHILAPTDFSDCASNAINFAIQTSKIFPVEITILHSFEVTSSLITDYQGINKEFNQSVLNEANQKLKELKVNVESSCDAIVNIILSTDNLEESIKRISITKKVDLIVMGTVGASGLKAKLWGSQTSKIIGETRIPVLAVPHGYKWKKPEKMLLASNQFEKDAATLNTIFEIAGLYMASVRVAVFTDEDDDKANKYLDNVAKISEYENFLKENYKEETLTSAHLHGANFEDTMQNYIKDNDIDLLIMITYQHNFWNRIFNPSKTKRMSFNSDIPLLAVPAGKNEE